MADAAATLELTDFSPLQEARTLAEVMAAASAVAGVVIPEFRARNPRTDPAVFAWWLSAAVAEFFHQRVDAEAQELQFTPAQRRSSIEEFLRLVGQAMLPPTAAECDVIVALRDGPSSTRDTPIPRYQGVQTSGGVRFVLFAGDALISMGTPSVRVRVMHGELLREPLDASDGTRLQQRTTAGANIVQNAIQQTLSVFVGPSELGPFEQYDVVSSFHASGPSSAHVRFRHAPDGRGVFTFGDGINGKIPPLGHVPFLQFVSGGGKAGNVPAGQLASLVEDIVVDGDSVAVTITQPEAAEGGRDAESLAQAKARAPAVWATQDRAVNLVDYGVLARGHPGVRDARGRRVGLDMIDVAVIGTGPSGVPSSGLRASVLELLRAKCWGGDARRGDTPNVRVSEGVLVPVRWRARVRARRGNEPSRVRPELLKIVAGYFDLDARLAAGGQLFGDPNSTNGHAYESDLIALFETYGGVENVDMLQFAREPIVVWDRRNGSAVIGAIDASSARASEEITLRFADATNFKVLASVSGDLGWGLTGVTFEAREQGVSFLVTGAGVYNDLARFTVSPPRGPVLCAANEYFVQGTFEAGDLVVVRT